MLVRQSHDMRSTYIDIIDAAQQDRVSIQTILPLFAWWSRISPTKIHCAGYSMLTQGYELAPDPVEVPKALIPYLEQYRDFLAQKAEKSKL